MKIKTVAIVTGASQGIGRATALRLAQGFSAIVLVARDKDKLEKTATEVRSVGAEAVIHALDLREAQSAEVVVNGTLDVLAESMPCSILRGPCRRLICSK